MRILYVEDDPLDVGLVQHYLTRASAGIQCEVAATRNEALHRLAQDQTFDLVLTDSHLPDGTGLELLSAIRARGDQVAVVMLTGLDDDQAAAAVFSAGADDYIIKGEGDYSKLAERLTAALSHYRHKSP
ncbi:MAG: response regulator [Blastocatellia bacterium]